MEQLGIAEKMQKVIIDAGGRFFSADELLKMTMADFVKNFYPNNITFTIKYEGKPK